MTGDATCGLTGDMTSDVACGLTGGMTGDVVCVWHPVCHVCDILCVMWCYT